MFIKNQAMQVNGVIGYFQFAVGQEKSILVYTVEPVGKDSRQPIFTAEISEARVFRA